MTLKGLHSVSSDVWTRDDWGIWFFLMVVAVTLRIVFYTGYFGSDEVTYVESAFRILQGDWSVSQYVGANRYGVNLPVAAFAYLFGQNEFAANLYSLLCSLGEIALVFYFGRLMLGLRVAVLATMVLIILPLHVHLAGRLLADSPLALMITASFCFFWDGERKNNTLSFLIAGLAAGFSFWIKPQAIFYLLVFLIYPVIFWRWNWKWTWMLYGFIFAVVGNMILLWALTSDPFYIFKAILSRHSSGYLEAGSIDQSPIYYLVYLFIKIWHTWIIAYLTILAVGIWLIRRRNLSQQENDSLRFTMCWAGGMLIVFSLLVVSWNPLIFIPKQTNYMLMFVAPLALLSGYTLAHLRGFIFWVAVGVVVLPSIMLTGMEQNNVHVFTANSKAAVEFARQHADAQVFSHTNPYRAASFHNLFKLQDQEISIRLISELIESSDDKQVLQNNSLPKYAIIDTETLWWGTGELIHDIKAIPSCWVQVGILEPSEFGIGWRMLNAIQVTGQLLPVTIHKRVTQNLDKLTRPKPAYIYTVPEGRCDFEKIPTVTINDPAAKLRGIQQTVVRNKLWAMNP